MGVNSLGLGLVSVGGELHCLAIINLLSGRPHQIQQASRSRPENH